MFKIKIDCFISFQSGHANYHIEHWLRSITGYLKYSHSQIFIITWIKLLVHADSSLDHFCQYFGDDELSLFSSFTFGLISSFFSLFRLLCNFDLLRVPVEPGNLISICIYKYKQVCTFLFFFVFCFLFKSILPQARRKCHLDARSCWE